MEEENVIFLENIFVNFELVVFNYSMFEIKLVWIIFQINSVI